MFDSVEPGDIFYSWPIWHAALLPLAHSWLIWQLRCYHLPIPGPYDSCVATTCPFLAHMTAALLPLAHSWPIWQLRCYHLPILAQYDSCVATTRPFLVHMTSRNCQSWVWIIFQKCEKANYGQYDSCVVTTCPFPVHMTWRFLVHMTSSPSVCSPKGNYVSDVDLFFEQLK